MTRSSARGTRQISFTPSAYTCGFSPARPKCSIAADVSRPWTPSASTVARACSSAPGSKAGPGRAVAQPVPCRPCARRVPRRRPISSVCASVSGSSITPSSSACSASARPSRASEKTWLPLLWNGGGVGRRIAARAAGEEVHRLAPHLAVARERLERARRAAARAGRPGSTTAPESWCEPTSRPLSSERDRHLAEPLGQLGIVGEELAEPDRRRESRRAAADDRDADVDALVLGRLGGRDHARELERAAGTRRERRASRASYSSLSSPLPCGSTRA